MLASIASATLLGVDGHAVTVEVHVGLGLPGFAVVGLPDTACKEARDRVRAAIMSSGFKWPDRKITVNLAPSALRKTGAGLDLAIAIGILEADGTLEAGLTRDHAFLGELGLDGSLRRVPGILSTVQAISEPTIVVPAGAAREASLVGRHHVRVGSCLGEVVLALKGEAGWPDAPPPLPFTPPPAPPDLADVRGQPMARFALEVAAAGGHHLLLTGPPGGGKTMLARRLIGILPPLEPERALETTRVHSAAGMSLPPNGLIERPPLRAPHHGASAVALIGGGAGWLKPGEISLATNGCLFLDELGEFPAWVLDHLRQPLEEGVIRISRAKATVSFPARFLLVAAMNPCPCGDGGPLCRCSDAARARYTRRLSGPLLDRFDLRVAVRRPDTDELLSETPGEASAAVAQRVADARRVAAERGVDANALLPISALERHVPLTSGARRVLEYRLRTGTLTGRGLHRVQRVARTVADLAGSEAVDESHICAALELRADSAAAAA